MPRHVLIATDFSEDAERATAHGAALARLLDAEVELFSAYHVGTASLGEAASWMPREFFERFAKQTRERLEELAEPIRAQGLEVSCTAVEDVPSRAIHRRAKERSVALIAMGTRGRTGLSHILLGSVAERVIRIAPCPVLTARDDHPEPGSYRRILVLTDFSPVAAAALDWARELTRITGGEIVLVHCVPPAFGVGEDEISADDDWTRERLQEGREKIATLAAAGERHEIVRGHPHSAGLEIAEREGAELVVLGTRGRSGLRHLLLGSNAERTVKESAVPVVVVPS